MKYIASRPPLIEPRFLIGRSEENFKSSRFMVDVEDIISIEQNWKDHYTIRVWATYGEYLILANWVHYVYSFDAALDYVKAE